MDARPFRQVHLDFHTSPLITGVGDDFDRDEFVRTLREARVNSVNIFAKCHHGYSYFPTKVGVVHPHLKRDLMGEMIESLHENDIRAIIYYSIVWDEYAAEIHWDWLQIDEEGREIGRPPLGDMGWRHLCLNTPYMEYVFEHVREIMDHYECDGFWFDIFWQHPAGCFCNSCLASLRKLGFDPSRESDRIKHNIQVERRAMAALTSLVHGRYPQSSIFYNGRQRMDNRLEEGLRPELPYYTHLEIESLASGKWGYLHFPVYQRYSAVFGKETVGMNGRFHRMWGDFGGLKNEAALDYECNRMLALGAKVCVGDQLHPRGRLDRATYALIGRTFREIEKKEEWCRDAHLYAEIGVFTCAQQDGTNRAAVRGRDSDEGAARILIERQWQFHFIDAGTDLAPYKLLILPDAVPTDARLREKLADYLRNGGALLLTHESGVDREAGQFAVGGPGLTYLGRNEYSVDYMRLTKAFAGDDLEADYDYVLYEGGSRVRADGGEVYATATHPYFNRSWDRFCSHAQTPPERQTDEPVIVKRGSVIYIASPLFRLYRQTGYRIYKDVIDKCLRILVPEPFIQSNLPSTAEVSVLAQGDRVIVHILHYIPERRADIDIIEDVIPLHDISLSIRAGFRPSRVYTAPDRQAVSHEMDGEYVKCHLPVITGHLMVVIEP